jgi:hypothetical protein
LSESGQYWSKLQNETRLHPKQHHPIQEMGHETIGLRQTNTKCHRILCVHILLMCIQYDCLFSAHSPHRVATLPTNTYDNIAMDKLFYFFPSYSGLWCGGCSANCHSDNSKIGDYIWVALSHMTVTLAFILCAWDTRKGFFWCHGSTTVPIRHCDVLMLIKLYFFVLFWQLIWYK